MLSVRQGIRAVKAVWSAGQSLLWELQRWRSGSAHPMLRVERRDSAHWGKMDVAATIVNDGARAAKDCRYCQYRVFSMSNPGAGGPASNAIAWYLSDSCSVPAGGSRPVKAHVSQDRCALIIMGDLVDGPLDATSCAEALVCRDRFGTLYRFSPGRDGDMEVWRATTLDRLLKREPPAWTAWLGYPSTVSSRAWTPRFTQSSRNA
jgi:hypothetical protein